MPPAHAIVESSGMGLLRQLLTVQSPSLPAPTLAETQAPAPPKVVRGEEEKGSAVAYAGPSGVQPAKKKTTPPAFVEPPAPAPASASDHRAVVGNDEASSDMEVVSDPVQSEQEGFDPISKAGKRVRTRQQDTAKPERRDKKPRSFGPSPSPKPALGEDALHRAASPG